MNYDKGGLLYIPFLKF